MRIKNLNSSFSVEFNHLKAFRKEKGSIRLLVELGIAGCVLGEFMASTNGK